ncbi:LysR substrate-binding domain-containing protein [Variovorax sp. LT2P21]|uniref:LysR substrate-binding domain-containing protein n=1 Tax=Variovorax sp. LT2P21 TaxID=3443731 RepID=UPI003F48B8EB
MQDLNDMVFFAEVAERGGFTAASKALGIPKSRLSRRVADLESVLGVQLLQRSTRRLSLTSAGEVYLRHCLEMRDAAQAAAEAVSQVQTEPRGTVRISCPVTLAQASVGPLLPIFMRRYPLVRVEMRVMNRPVDPVEDGVDLALRVRTVVEDSATLAARQFGISRGLLVINAERMAHQGQINGPEDLVRIDTVGMSAGEGRAVLPLHGPDGKLHQVPHHPRYVADDLLALKSAIVQGIGAGMLPDYMCRREIKSGELVELLPGWTPPAGIVHAMFAPRRAQVPAVRHLIDFLAEHLDGDEPHATVRCEQRCSEQSLIPESR